MAHNTLARLLGSLLLHALLDVSAAHPVLAKTPSAYEQARPSSSARIALLGQQELERRLADHGGFHQRVAPHRKSFISLGRSGSSGVHRNCLQGSLIFYMGFSEVGRQVSWLKDSLDCSTGPNHPKFGGPPTINGWISKCMGGGAHAVFLRKAQKILKDQLIGGASEKRPTGSSAIKKEAEHMPLRDALCREHFFGVAPINMTCPSAGLNISYRWKSFQSDAYDTVTRQQVVDAAQESESPVFVVLEGGGPHHFTKFPDHRFLDSWANPDFAQWPQHWIDDWVASTRKLFQTFSPKMLPPNVCVVHKNMNIAPRVLSSQTDPHHPSTVGGLHHWLNRISSALSQEFGIHPIDLSHITQTTIPLGALGCNSTENGLRSAVKCQASDGDPFHGFPPGLLARELLRQMCSRCNLQCGKEPVCELPIGVTPGDLGPVKPK